jgi:hypothetical protein
MPVMKKHTCFGLTKRESKQLIQMQKIIEEGKIRRFQKMPGLKLKPKTIKGIEHGIRKLENQETVYRKAVSVLRSPGVKERLAKGIVPPELREIKTRELTPTWAQILSGAGIGATVGGFGMGYLSKLANTSDAQLFGGIILGEIAGGSAGSGVGMALGLGLQKLKYLSTTKGKLDRRTGKLVYLTRKEIEAVTDFFEKNAKVRQTAIQLLKKKEEYLRNKN